jgi:hypothetical protein
MEVKGTAVIAIRDFVKNSYPSEYKRWLDSLSSNSKEIFAGSIDSTKWYQVELAALEPTLKISELFFDNNHSKGAWDSGRYSAEKALSGIYKIFVKASSPAYIIQRASRVFATYYQPCEMRVLNTTDSGCVVEISKMDKKYDVIDSRIAGWIEKALEISGAKDIKLSLAVKPTDESIREIIISWN